MEKKRTELDMRQKREICIYKENHPQATHEEISKYFNGEWKTAISRRTIGDILSQKDKWCT